MLHLQRLTIRPKLVGIKKKLERREATRERKALAAAKLEKSIEKELLERLRSKAYGDAPLNVNEDVWRQVLDLDKGKDRLEDMEDDDSVLDEEEWEGGEREFVEDSDDESVDDLEDYSGSEFDEFDSEGEESGQDFPSDLEVSDEEDDEEEDGEGEDGEDEEPKEPKKGKKPPTSAAGQKRKAPREPKRAGKKRKSLVCSLVTVADIVRPARQRRVRDGDRAPLARDDQQLVILLISYFHTIRPRYLSGRTLHAYNIGCRNGVC